MKKAVILFMLIVAALLAGCNEEKQLKNAGNQTGKEMLKVIRKTDSQNPICTVYDKNGAKLVDGKAFEITNQFIMLYDSPQLIFDLNDIDYFTYNGEEDRTTFLIYLQ